MVRKITRRLMPLSDSMADSYGKIIREGGGIIVSGEGNIDYTCGKCNNLLMINMHKDQFMMNAALFCENCKTFNDACNHMSYLGSPVMLKDIPKTVQNSIVFDYNTYDSVSRIPFAIERGNLSDRLYSEWITEHFQMPGVLFQYTSFYGLIGMLSNHSIWVTDVAYMNDTSEMKYGLDLINNYINEKIKSVSEECKHLLNRAIKRQSAFDASRGYLIACFCSNDDLLSQWRAYGSGGNGYNIGFSSKHMAKTENVQIRKVIYDLSKQQEYISKTVDLICELFEASKGSRAIGELDDQAILPAFVSMLDIHLNEFLYTFKHSAFSEEAEWRIIRPYRNILEDRNKLKFRQYNSIPVPYMELGLKDINYDFPFLPVVQVTHGPALHPQLTKKSLSMIMIQNGYSHSEIKGSKTPLRL